MKTLIFVLSVISRQYLDHPPFVQILQYFFSCLNPFMITLSSWPSVSTLLQFLNALSSVNGSWYSCWWLSLLQHHCRSQTTVNELGHSRSPIKRRLRVWVCGDVVSALKPAPLCLTFDLLPWWPHLMTIPGDCYLGDLISWLFLGTGTLVTSSHDYSWGVTLVISWLFLGSCLGDLTSWLFLGNVTLMTSSHDYI